MTEVTPEMRAIMDETMAMLKSGKTVPDPLPLWWETRREGEPTPNYLGRVLDEAGLPDLARRAREGQFDDYQAPADVADGLEIIRLAAELRTVAAGLAAYTEAWQRIHVIENALRRGEFDATKAESDRWAASADGQRTFDELVRSAAKPGRNDPVPVRFGPEVEAVSRSMTLNLATRGGLALPDSVVGARTSILGQPGTGKTSTAVVVIEEAASIGAHFVVVDPTGAWHGLASNAKGNGPGVDCVVMGGQHGDVPLDKDAGRICAELVADQGYNLVLDLDGLGSWAARQHFVADFALELYERAHSQILVVVDEAHRFAPQGRADGDAARCLGAISDLVLLGRRRGIGSVTITQRPARLNKDVLEAAELLIAHRVRGNNDAKALGGWIEEHGENLREMLAEVAGLANGRARVSAPTLGINGVFAIRAKRTFDSSRSIDIGEVAIQPTARAEVDMDALRERMATTIEKAKAADPKALRARIKALEASLQAQVVEQLVTPDELAELRRRAALAKDHQHRLDALGDIAEQAARLARGVDDLPDWRDARLADFTPDDGAARSAPSSTKGVHASAAPERPRAQAPADRGTGRTADDGGRGRSPGGESAPSFARAATGNGSGVRLEVVTPARQRVLDALAWFAQLGIPAPARAALAPLAGSKATSGGFKNNLGALRTAGLIEYPQSNCVALTPEGSAAADWPERAGTSEDLQAAVLATLTPARQALLRELIDAHPDSLTREELAEAVGVPPTSGGFKNNLGAMRTQGVIDYPQQGTVVAADLLFVREAGTR